MDRHSFLRGQLWLRPLTDGELHGATDGQGSSQGRQQRGSSGQQQTVQLLPPPLTRSDADGNTSTTVSSWCCFNVGPRFCIFCPGERGEDQTQFELKLTLKIPIDDASDSASAAPTLFARFDGKEAYALNLAQIIEVKMPNTRPLPESHALANGSEPPPYGCLDFGNASLRVWMDPQQVSHSCARDALQQALEQIQLYARQARQVSSRLEKTAATSEPSWRSIYRYNQLLQDERSDRIAVLPSDFEKRARELLSNGDDFEAVKMVISKIDQGKRSKKRRRMRLSQSDHDHDQESVANRNDEEPYSNLEVIMLVTELCHVLGEDHEGLNQLLELSDSNGCCKSHDRCFSFSASPSAVDTGDCIVSRWNAWDGFIELSQLVLKSKRINSHSHRNQQQKDENSKTIYTAGMAWRHAIVQQHDVTVVSQRMARLRSRIKTFEDITFKRLYPTRSAQSNTATALGEDGDAEPATRRRQEVREQLERETSRRMLDFLRQKRRRMLREELAAQLLPHRG